MGCRPSEAIKGRLPEWLCQMADPLDRAGCSLMPVLLELGLKLLDEAVNDGGPGDVSLPDVGFGPEESSPLALRAGP